MFSQYHKWDRYDVDKELEKVEKNTHNEALLKPLGNASLCNNNGAIRAADASLARRDVESMKKNVPLSKRKLYRTISSTSSFVNTLEDRASSSKNFTERLSGIKEVKKTKESTLASHFFSVTDSLQKLYQIVVLNSMANYHKGFNLAINILNEVFNILNLLVIEKREMGDKGCNIDTRILHYLMTQTTSYLSICSLNMKQFAVCINISRMNILLNQMEYEDIKKSNGCVNPAVASSLKKSRYVEAMNWVARGCAFFFCGGYYSAYRQLLSAQAIHPTFSGLAIVTEKIAIKLRDEVSFLDKGISLIRELIFILRRQQQIKNNYRNDTCIDINNDLSLQYLDTSLHHSDLESIQLKSSDDLVSEFILDGRLLRENILLMMSIFYEAQTFFCESLYYTAEIKYISLILLLKRMIISGLYNNKSLDKLISACFFNAAVCRTQRIALDALHTLSDECTDEFSTHDLLYCSAKQMFLKGLDHCNCFEGMLRLAHYYEKVESYDEAHSLLSKILEYVASNTYTSNEDNFVWDYGKGSLLDHKFLTSPSIPLFHVNEMNQVTIGQADKTDQHFKHEAKIYKIKAKLDHIQYLMKTFM